MYQTRINLVTLLDVNKFVNAIRDIEGTIKLIDGKGYCVSAKSIVGAIAALEWKELYCVSSVDIYNKIKEFAI